MLSFTVYGRGGQGVTSATRLLSQAAFLSGFTVQSYAPFTLEMRGAPALGYVKLDKAPIVSRQAEPPDYLLVLDRSLPLTLLKEAGNKAVVIFNAAEKTAAVAGKRKFKSYHVDAGRIALETLKKPIPNTAMLGGLLKLFPKISLKSMRTALEAMPLQRENTAAMEAGYREIKS